MTNINFGKCQKKNAYAKKDCKGEARNLKKTHKC